MDLVFDVDKDARNQSKHGPGLAAAAELDWSTALVWHDNRHDYGECRFVALALRDCRVHCAVYVERDGKRRIISLRKANYREAAYYAQQAYNHPADD